jgi:hypothetical protein
MSQYSRRRVPFLFSANQNHLRICKKFHNNRASALLGTPAEAAVADAPAFGAGPGLLFGHLFSVLTIPKQ